MTENFENRYKIINTILAILLIFLMIISFSLGRYKITLDEIFDAFYNKINSVDIENPSTEAILFHVRLPRIIFSVLVGGALSVAGCCYQGVFRNPLVSADVVGASSGASFGAALAILMGFSTAKISLSAFVWSIIAVTIVYLVGRVLKGNPVLGLVLSGIMISSLFNSGISLLKLLADPMDELPQITYWLMGSLAGTKQKDILPIFFIMLVSYIPLRLLRWNINLLTMGDDEAKTMGVNVNAVRLIVIICATLLTASSIAVSGMIGWISLSIPHFARMLVGNDYRILLPTSMLLGANFLLIVDNISRLAATAEIPLGIITSFVGVPFFLCLLYKESRKI